LKTCEECQRFFGDFKISAVADVASPEKMREIERSIVAGLRPVRPVAGSGYLLAALLAIFVGAVAMGVLSLGQNGLRAMTTVQAAVALGALAAAAAWLAWSLANQVIPGSRYRVSPRFLPLAILATLAIVITILFPVIAEKGFWLEAWGCIRRGTPVAALAGLLLWPALRRYAVLTPVMTGAAAGLLAGLAGESALQIYCPNLNVRHILVAHLGVSVLGIVTGLFIGYCAELLVARALVLRRP
jgi:hypothetical protein